MNSNETLGLIIGSLVTLFTLGSLIVGLIIKPIINLNKSIVKLNDSIDKLNGDNDEIKQRVTRHGKEIDENRIHLAKHDKDIEHIKERLK